MTAATFDQYLQFGQMVSKGAVSRQLMQAMLEGRVLINPEVRRAERFVVKVGYYQPRYRDLKKLFDVVTDDYRRGAIHFEPISVCQDVRTIGEPEISFELVSMGMESTSVDVLAHLEARELRPALHEELIAFSLAYPKMQLANPIVALGSNLGGVVSVICSHREQRMLRTHRFGGPVWTPDFRFLAARK